MAHQDTQAAGSGTDAALELESYNDKTLPHNERLQYLHHLVGHEITHVFDRLGERGDTGEVLLVTQTGCWMVLEAKTDAWDREHADVQVVQDHEHGRARRRLGRPERLSDYITPEQLREARLIGQGEFNLLFAQKKAAQDKEREKKAAHLREQLAKLEGGAA